MGNPAIPLNVDPGLFEWGWWFQKHGTIPAFLEWSDLIHHKYSINTAYHPAICREEIRLDESLSEFYQRNHTVVQNALANHPEGIFFSLHIVVCCSCAE